MDGLRLALAPLVAALLAAFAAAQDALSVGDDVTGELAPGGERVYVLEHAAAGPLHVALDSFDFDARLVLRAGGEELARDEDGGVETNARLALDAAPAGALTVVVSAAGGRGGAFELATSAEPLPLPAGADLLQAAAEFRATAAERAREREDLAAAVEHQKALGDRLLALGRLPDALAAFEQLERDADALDEERWRGIAANCVAVAASATGDQDRARERYRAALEASRAADDELTELKVLGNLGVLEHRLGAYDDAVGWYEEQIAVAARFDDPAAAGLEAGARSNLGNLLRDLGRLDEAVEQLEAALDLFERTGERARVAGCRNGLALVEEQRGHADAALAHAEAAIEELRAIGDRGSLAWVLTTRARLLSYAGRLREARDSVEEALATARENGDPYAESWALSQLAETSSRLGDLPRALELHERRLALSERLGDAVGSAWARYGVGSLLQRLGRPHAAEAPTAAALAAATELGLAQLRARCLYELGRVRHLEQKLDEAERLYTDSLETARAAGTLEVEGYALGSLGVLASTRGRLDEGLRRLDEARARFEAGGNLEGLLWVEQHRGRALRCCGRVQESAGVYRELERAAEEAGARGYVASAQEGLAAVAHDLGDFRAAETAYERGRAIRLRMGQVGEATRDLLDLADVRLHVADFEVALELARRGEEAARALDEPTLVLKGLAVQGNALLSSERTDAAAEVLEALLARARDEGLLGLHGSELTNLGYVRREQGRYDEGRALLRERLELADERDDRIGRGWGLAELAELECAAGDPVRGAELAEQALALARGISYVEVQLRALGVLAQVALERGELSELARRLEAAEALIDRPSTGELELADAAGLRSRYVFWGRVSQDLAAARVAAADDDAARAAATEAGFRDAGRWKARALLAGIREHRSGARNAAARELRRARAQALLLRENVLRELADAGLDEAPTSELERLRARCAELDAEVAGLEERLRAASPADAAIDLPDAPGCAQVTAAALDERTALVELAEGTRRLHAYVLTTDGARHLTLGELAPLRDAADAYLASFASPAALPPLAECLERGADLYERVLAAPLAALPEGIERLVVVPADCLDGLPLEALGPRPRDGGPARLVIDRYEVTYAPSSGVLVELERLPPREGAARVLVMADPVYASEGAEPPPTPEKRELPSLLASRSAPRLEALERLEKTRTEAFALVETLHELGDDGAEVASGLQELRRRRSGTLSGALFDLYLGAAASRARLGHALRGYAVLHFAAHGFVDPQRPRRSGLALAASDADPGLLTIEDALELDLDANLVVLSACETARGETLAGEGVQSLARAFLHAGARGVVASAWQVSDRAAAETMREFYRGALERGLSPAAALRAAKLHLRDAGELRGVAPGADAGAAPAAHPFFWAPFLNIGLP